MACLSNPRLFTIAHHLSVKGQERREEGKEGKGAEEEKKEGREEEREGGGEKERGRKKGRLRGFFFQPYLS